MADSGGHWATLAQAAKLTQSTKIPGVFEEDVKRNPPLERVPVAQAAGTGLKIEWLREKTTAEDAAAEIDIGSLLSWSDDIEYDEVEATLRQIYIQRKLDRYVERIYGTYNDYKAIVLLESEKGLKRKINDRFIYADTTYGGSPTQMDGIHALAAERGTPNSLSVRTDGGDLNFDMEDGALSLFALRTVLDAMVFGTDEIWVSKEIGIRFDAAYEEKGFVGLKADTAGSLALLTRGYNDIGKPILFFAGIPIIRMDYLLAEESNTGTGATSNARAKYSSDKTYSIFLIKRGNVMEREPGICYGFGGTEGLGDLYELVMFDKLENYHAGGIRLVNNGTVMLGSTKCMARIFDVDDLALVV